MTECTQESGHRQFIKLWPKIPSWLNVSKRVAIASLSSCGRKYHHDWMYARKWPSPAYVLSCLWSTPTHVTKTRSAAKHYFASQNVNICLQHQGSSQIWQSIKVTIFCLHWGWKQPLSFFCWCVWGRQGGGARWAGASSPCRSPRRLLDRPAVAAAEKPLSIHRNRKYATEQFVAPRLSKDDEFAYLVWKMTKKSKKANRTIKNVKHTYFFYLIKRYCRLKFIESRRKFVPKFRGI